MTNIQSNTGRKLCWASYYVILLPIAIILCFVVCNVHITFHYDIDTIQFFRYILLSQKWCEGNTPSRLFESEYWKQYYQFMTKIWNFLINEVKVSNHLKFNQQIGCINYHILNFCVTKDKEKKLKAQKAKEIIPKSYPKTNAEKFLDALKKCEHSCLMANVIKDIITGKTYQDGTFGELLGTFISFVSKEIEFEISDLCWLTDCCLFGPFKAFYAISRANLVIFPIYGFCSIVDFDKIYNLSNLDGENIFAQNSIAIFEIFYLGFFCWLVFGYCLLVLGFVGHIIPLYYRLHLIGVLTCIIV